MPPKPIFGTVEQRMHGKDKDRISSRWSARRALVFIAVLSALLWALIYLGFRALLS
jgi:hypothetical protein